MGGLSVVCILLGIGCGLLLFRLLWLNRRIRRLTEQVDGFPSGRTEIVDVALEEDALAGLQNAVADLEQALERARQLKTEECNRTSQLTADISHQLKTPLTTLRLYTELDGAEHMEESLAQIQRMETLIQALLRLERLCADGYAFSFSYVRVEDILREQWQRLESLWPEKQLKVTGEARIRCDREWLGEAFLNLLKNACEHTACDGIIWVNLERTEAAFFCTVEDNGGGVAPAELPRLFQRFYRAEHQSTNGVGIGLAIVREIVERHHGTIVAENGQYGLKMKISMPMLDENMANT